MKNIDISMPYYPLSDASLEVIDAFKQEWYQFYRNISDEKTPAMDGTGKKIIDKKGSTGYDYIEESHMRNMLDKHFPGWSWEAAAPLQFLGSEWVVAQGHLCIVDSHLMAFGIVPPVRKFYGVDSVRIQFKKDTQHVPENIVDVGDNCKQAVTSALKFAINRMCRIGDDVYGKRTEYDGAGTIDDMMIAHPGAASFSKWISEKKGTWSEIFRILGVKSIDDIKDFDEARFKVKSVKGW
jgi:hypothetical protein